MISNLRSPMKRIESISARNRQMGLGRIVLDTEAPTKPAEPQKNRTATEIYSNLPKPDYNP